MSPLSFHSDLRGGERPAPPYRSGISRFDAVRHGITNMKKKKEKKEKSLSGGAVNTSRPDGFGFASPQRHARASHLCRRRRSNAPRAVQPGDLLSWFVLVVNANDIITLQNEL